MKKFIIPFIIALAMTTNSFAQTFNEAEFSDHIITAFKAKSFDSFKRLSVDTIDFNEILSDYGKDYHVSAHQDKSIKEKSQQFADSSEMMYRSEFDRLISKGEKIGIDWSQIKKSKFVFEKVKPINSAKYVLSGHLNFKCKGKTFVFFGIEAIEVSSGFKITSIRTVLESGVDEYINPDLLDDDDI